MNNNRQRTVSGRGKNRYTYTQGYITSITWAVREKPLSHHRLSGLRAAYDIP